MAILNVDAEKRVLAIEEALSVIWTAMKSMVNKDQFNRLWLFNQKERQLLIAKLDSIETALETLETTIDNTL